MKKIKKSLATKNTIGIIILLLISLLVIEFFPTTFFTPSNSESSLTLDNTSRYRISLNNDWKFSLSQTDNSIKDIASISKNSWEKINLPHTWNINDCPTDTSSFLRGIGWYQKELMLLDNLKGKRLFLNFEGANQVSTIFINGKKAGSHIGGYTAFTVDITNYTKFGTANIITVKVNNEYDKNIPPLSADYVFYGGIYRDVWLIATDPVHITLSDYGSKGVFISTPSVSKKVAVVEFEGTINNSSSKTREINIVNKIFDNAGNEISQVKSSITIKPNQQIKFKQTSKTINSPNLWSPKDPALYRVYTELYESNKLIDRVKNPLGFRYFSFDPKKGIFLNGEHLKLIGTNRHQDYEGLGNALPNRLHVEDLIDIKEAGFNFLRLAHYPQDPVVLETADSLGLIIWEEIPIVNYVTTSDEFKENSKHMLKEMIRQHYNHPSIIFWGYMNEVFLHDANGNRVKNHMYYPDDYLQWTVQLADELNDLAIKEDSSRLTTMAIHQDEIYDETGIANVPQTLGYNLYPGWYFGQMSSMGKFLDEEHEKYPSRKIILSEYGAGSDERIHSYQSEAFDFSTEFQQEYHENYFKQIVERPYLGVSAIWAQNDFRSDGRGDSKPRINQKGLQYYNRTHKDIYYFYKASLTEKPVLHIASKDWTIRSGDFSQESISNQTVKIYTNLDEIEVQLNNQSLGYFDNNGSNILYVNIPFRKGSNFILASGENITDKTLITLKENLNELKTFAPHMELAVNVGATNQFIDSSHLIWEEDQEYTHGSWGYLGGKNKTYSVAKPVLGSNNDPLYQTLRNEIKSYKFDVPKGDYEIELCFVENKYKKVGNRIMNISVNDLLIWKSIDLVKEFGYLQAANQKTKVKIESNQNLKIKFDAVKGETTLSGIRLKKLN